jgi:hypothetical protein
MLQRHHRVRTWLYVLLVHITYLGLLIVNIVLFKTTSNEVAYHVQLSWLI